MHLPRCSDVMLNDCSSIRDSLKATHELARVLARLNQSAPLC